jgi:hypothetical protein
MNKAPTVGVPLNVVAVGWYRAAGEAVAGAAANIPAIAAPATIARLSLTLV